LQRLGQSVRLQRVFTASPIAPPRGFAAPRHARVSSAAVDARYYDPL